MSDLVVDSSVVAKWLLPEADSAKAQQLIVETTAARERLIVLDLVFPEVANAIWKRYRQHLVDLSEAMDLIDALVSSPVRNQRYRYFILRLGSPPSTTAPSTMPYS